MDADIGVIEALASFHIFNNGDHYINNMSSERNGVDRLVNDIDFCSSITSGTSSAFSPHELVRRTCPSAICSSIPLSPHAEQARENRYSVAGSLPLGNTFIRKTRRWVSGVLCCSDAVVASTPPPSFRRPVVRRWTSKSKHSTSPNNIINRWRADPVTLSDILPIQNDDQCPQAGCLSGSTSFPLPSLTQSGPRLVSRTSVPSHPSSDQVKHVYAELVSPSLFSLCEAGVDALKPQRLASSAFACRPRPSNPFNLDEKADIATPRWSVQTKLPRPPRLGGKEEVDIAHGNIIWRPSLRPVGGIEEAVSTLTPILTQTIHNSPPGLDQFRF